MEKRRGRKLRAEPKTRVVSAKLNALILEGLNSGDPIEVNDEFWRELRRDLLRKVRKKKRRN
jgi:antitoxin ParD1/3/4